MPMVLNFNVHLQLLQMSWVHTACLIIKSLQLCVMTLPGSITSLHLGPSLFLLDMGDRLSEGPAQITTVAIFIPCGTEDNQCSSSVVPRKKTYLTETDICALLCDNGLPCHWPLGGEHRDRNTTLSITGTSFPVTLRIEVYSDMSLEWAKARTSAYDYVVLLSFRKSGPHSGKIWETVLCLQPHKISSDWKDVALKSKCRGDGDVASLDVGETMKHDPV